MITLRPRQMAILEAEQAEEFLGQAVADWFAIYEAIERQPARLDYEGAYDLAASVMDVIDSSAHEAAPGFPVQLIHQSLSAAAAQVPVGDCLRAAAEAVRLLPADEAALILHSAMLGV
jgi:hypothetical protein